MKKLMQAGALILISIITFENNSYAGMGPLQRVLHNLPKKPKPTPAPWPIRPPPNRPPRPAPAPPPRPELPPNQGVAPEIKMSDPNYLGAGCPAGSVVTVLSPDQTVLSVLFNEFINQAGPTNGLHEDKKICRLTIPMSISNGRYQVKVTRADFRGLVMLPEGTAMYTTGIYSISSPDYPNIKPQSVSMLTTIMNGPLNDEYFYSVIPNDSGYNAHGFPTVKTTWSSCSNRHVMRLESQVNLQNKPMQDDAMATVDSIDAVTTTAPGIEYQISWRPCKH